MVDENPPATKSPIAVARRPGGKAASIRTTSDAHKSTVLKVEFKCVSPGYLRCYGIRPDKWSIANGNGGSLQDSHIGKAAVVFGMVQSIPDKKPVVGAALEAEGGPFRVE